MSPIAKLFYGTPVKRMTNAQMTDLEIAGFATGHCGDEREDSYVAIRASERRSAIGMAVPVRPLQVAETWIPQLAAALAKHDLEAAGPPGWYLVSYLDA